MALVKGRDGIVKVGSAVVAGVQSFTLNFDLDTLDGTSMGDANKVYLVGDMEVSGTIDVNTSTGDAAQAALNTAMLAKTVVTLELYDEGGDGTGKKYWTGDAVISSLAKTADRGELVKSTYNWFASGAWTQETVS